jgi:hypothetical protein
MQGLRMMTVEFTTIGEIVTFVWFEFPIYTIVSTISSVKMPVHGRSDEPVEQPSNAMIIGVGTGSFAAVLILIGIGVAIVRTKVKQDDRNDLNEFEGTTAGGVRVNLEDEPNTLDQPEETNTQIVVPSPYDVPEVVEILDDKLNDDGNGDESMIWL